MSDESSDYDSDSIAPEPPFGPEPPYEDDLELLYVTSDSEVTIDSPNGPRVIEETLNLYDRERFVNGERLDLGGSDYIIMPRQVSEEGTDLRVYDQNLTSAHKYLGDGLRERTGRTIFEEGVIHTIPVIFLELNLIPGHILPISARYPSVQQILKYALSSNCSFGVSYKLNENSRTFGTIAEVYEHSVDIENVNSFQIKAMGHQRYVILNLSKFPDSSDESIALAQIKIVSDITLSHPFNKLCLHQKKRYSNHSGMCCKRGMWQTQWPDWVYKQFDVHQLASRLSKKVRMLYPYLKIALDPEFLSFQLTRLGILDPEQVSFLLGIESTNQRLQYELQFLNQNQYMEQFICVRNNCGTDICQMSNAFSMSPEGPLGTYCDYLGEIHDMITVRTLNISLRLVAFGNPSTECCWFPGYEWVIILCPSCRGHLGWYYMASDSTLIPRSFYGLVMRFITPIKNYRSPGQNRDNLEEVNVNND